MWLRWRSYTHRRQLPLPIHPSTRTYSAYHLVHCWCALVPAQPHVRRMPGLLTGCHLNISDSNVCHDCLSQCHTLTYWFLEIGKRKLQKHQQGVVISDSKSLHSQRHSSSTGRSSIHNILMDSPNWSGSTPLLSSIFSVLKSLKGTMSCT